MQKIKMRKSSSVAVFKMDFNPKEFQIGESKITQLSTKLPKVESRRYSASHIVKPKNNNEPTQIETLRKLNDLYQKQNDQLKKQIQSLKKIAFPQQKSLLGSTLPNQQFSREDKAAGYRQLIKSKMMNKSKCSSRVVTECQTGLFSSKEVSYGESELVSIADYYDTFSTSGSRPSFKDLQQISLKFFKDYSENYSKLTYMFTHLEQKDKTSEYKQFLDLLEIYKVPLLYNKNPKLLIKELSKQKSLKKRKEDEICFETLSPEQTVKKIETILARVLKSSKLLISLRGNQIIKSFVSKYLQVNYAKIFSRN